MTRSWRVGAGPQALLPCDHGASALPGLSASETEAFPLRGYTRPANVCLEHVLVNTHTNCHGLVMYTPLQSTEGFGQDAKTGKSQRPRYALSVVTVIACQLVVTGEIVPIPQQSTSLTMTHFSTYFISIGRFCWAKTATMKPVSLGDLSDGNVGIGGTS